MGTGKSAVLACKSDQLTKSTISKAHKKCCFEAAIILLQSSSKSKSRATPSNPAPNATTTSAGHPSATGSSGGTPGVDKKPSGGSKGE